jgi:hypothetical protein
MWIFNAIATAVGKNFIGTPNYLFGLLFNRVKADGGVTEAQQCTIEELTELQNDNLLSSASLVVTPSSYKEGKLYSVIPSDGSGDLSVTRATTATRVNSAGLVELVPYNLLTYSQTFENVAWSKSLSSIDQNIEVAPDGTLTADKLIANTTLGIHNIFQSPVISINNQYTASVYVKKAGYAAIRINYFSSATTFIQVNLDTGIINSFGGTAYQSSSITDAGNGWYRCTMTFTPTVSGTLNFIIENPINTVNFSGNGTSGIYLWGAQLNEGTLKDYFATETRLNIPRLDYSLGSCPSILVEPQRTNLALWSEQFDNAVWVKAAASVTANSTTSPSGLINADKLVEDTASTHHSAAQSVLTIIGTIYNISFYAKASERGYIQWNNTLTADFANFDLINGVVGTSSGITNQQIQSVGNGWYRCSLNYTGTFAGLASVFRLTIVLSASASRLQTYLGNGTSGLFLWGAQAEVGAYPTSYIPTTSASVTRNADVLSRTNVYTNGWIVSSGGTWFVDLKNTIPFVRSNSNLGLFLSTVSNGFGGDGFVFYNNLSSSQRPVLAKYVSGTITALATLSSDNSKIAIKWNGTTADVFENGVKIVSATSFAGTAMQFISNQPLQIPFNINAMALWPTPLNDGELSILTSGRYTPELAYAAIGLTSESPACLESSINAIL